MTPSLSSPPMFPDLSPTQSVELSVKELSRNMRSASDAARCLDEAQAIGTREIGFTGGEPFMNPQFLPMLTDALERGFEALVLSNAMRPMRRHEAALLALRERFGSKLTVRVSVPLTWLVPIGRR